MALKHVLMGFLTYRPTNGYRLHKMFAESFRPTLPQIYRALNEMADAGLVRSNRIHQKKLPARNVFHLTEAGYVEFERWLKEEPLGVAVNEPFLQRIWFGNLANREDTIAYIKAYGDKKKDEIEYYDRTISQFDEQSLKMYGTPLDRFYWDLAFDYIRRRAKAELEWAEATIQHISSFKPEDIEMVKQRKGGRRRTKVNVSAMEEKRSNSAAEDEGKQQKR